MASPFSLIQKAVPPKRDPTTGEWPEYRSLLESLTFNTPEEYAKLPKPGAIVAPATVVDNTPTTTAPTDDPDAMNLDTPTTPTFPADVTPMLIDADDADAAPPPAISSPLYPRPRITPSWNLWPIQMSPRTLSLYTLILAPKYQHYFELTSPLLPFRERDVIAGRQLIKYYALWYRSQQNRVAMARLVERRKAEAEARKIEEEENGEWTTGVERRAPTKTVKRRVERVVKVGDEEWWSDSDDDGGEGEGGAEGEDDEDEDDEDEDEDDDGDDDDNDNDDGNEEGDEDNDEEEEEEVVVVQEVDVRRKKGKDRVIVEWVEEEEEVDLEEEARETVAKGEGTEAEMEGMVEMYRWLGVHEGIASVSNLPDIRGF